MRSECRWLVATAPRDRLLCVLGFETGLRIGDVWSGGAPVQILRVTRHRLKSRRGERARSVRSRAVPLNSNARRTLLEHFGLTAITNKDALLFPSREGDSRAITMRQATRIIRKIFLIAGCDPAGVWAGHSLRRRFVRRIFDATGDINVTREAVGHRYIATTQLYLGLVEEEAHAAILMIGCPAQTTAPVGVTMGEAI